MASIMASNSRWLSTESYALSSPFAPRITLRVTAQPCRVHVAWRRRHCLEVVGNQREHVAVFRTLCNMLPKPKPLMQKPQTAQWRM